MSWLMAALVWRRWLIVSIHRRSSISPFSAATTYVPCPEHTINFDDTSSSSSNLDESVILDQLSDLLPIQRKQTPIPNLYVVDSPQQQQQQIQPLVADEFLAPEDKLRGIFLQKIKGTNAIHLALSNTGVDVTLDLFAKVVNRGNLGGESMLMLFNWVLKQPKIPNNHIATYNILVKALGRRKFFTFMIQILHQMNLKNISPNSETLMIVMDSFITARHISKAIQLFEKLDEFGSKCDTESLNVLLHCLCQRSYVGSANSLVNSMKGKIPLNTTSYNVIIGGWSKLGNVNQIENMMKDMIINGLDPDSFTFAHLLEGLGRCGRMDDAVQVFDKMTREKGYDTCIINAMIYNFISIKDFDTCMKYYQCMSKQELEPNLETYRILISGFLKARKVADSLELFDEMLSKNIMPTTGLITSFMKPLCKYGPPYAAMWIYKRGKKAGCKISVSAYKLLLMRLSRFGKCGSMLRLWNEMQENDYEVDVQVYEYVINGLCNIGQVDNAVMVMEEALCKGFCPSKLICSKLNNKLLNFNKVEAAYNLFLKLKRARDDENATKYWRYKGWHF